MAAGSVEFSYEAEEEVIISRFADGVLGPAGEWGFILPNGNTPLTRCNRKRPIRKSED